MISFEDDSCCWALDLLQPIFFGRYIIISLSVLCKNKIVVFKVKVIVKVQNFIESLCISYLLYHWSLDNQTRCVDLLFLITKPSTTKWAYTDSSTFTFRIISINRHTTGGLGHWEFCRLRWQTLLTFKNSQGNFCSTLLWFSTAQGSFSFIHVHSEKCLGPTCFLALPKGPVVLSGFSTRQVSTMYGSEIELNPRDPQCEIWSSER